MSAEPLPAVSEPVSSAWQQLDHLVDEIASLAHSDLSQREFWRLTLDRVTRALAAVGGAVWLQNNSGESELACQIDCSAAPWHSAADAQRRHADLLAHVAETELALSLPPHSGAAHERGRDNPSPYLLLLVPVVADRGTVAVLEVLQRPVDLPNAPEGYLQFMSAVAELAADFEQRRQLGELRERASTWHQFDRFAQTVHGSLDLDRVAYTVANDGRRMLGCDRLSVAVVAGRKAKLACVSGVETLDRRAATVRQLERLIRAVVAIDEPLRYPADARDLPPQLEQTLHAYLDESHARRLTVLPLHLPDEEQESGTAPAVIGALVIEDFTDGAYARSFDEQVEAVTAQSALAMANALEYESLPLVWLWRALGLRRWLVERKRLPKTVLVAVATVVAVAALVLVPIDFTVEAEGELLPAERQDVFAPVDGVVADIQVAHGDQVTAGQPLVVLRKPQLDFERTRVLGELQTARKRQAALQTSRFGGAAAAADARDQFHQRTADEEEVKEQIKSLTSQLAVLDSQQEELVVRSPIAGKVLTWDPAKLLAARPVERGQLLLSVGNVSGPWELELRVPDDRMGHVLAAQRQAGAGLPVSFLLAMEPLETYEARLTDIALTTDTLDQAGPQVLVTATVDRDAIPRLRPGASVSARIDCGRRSAGYVWLHDLWDALYTRVLF